MKQPLRITRRAFSCIAIIALIVFGARVSAAADFGSPPAKHPSIIGTWISHAKGGTKSTYVFKADNTVVLTAGVSSVSAKYKIDYSTKPIHLEIFDFNVLNPDEKVTWRAILEFEGESRFRMAFKPIFKPSGEEVGEDAIVFTKEEVSAAAEHPSIIGTWLGQAEDGTKVTLVFKADNTVLYTRNEPNNLQEPPREDVPSSLSAKYKIDYSTKPIQLDIFDFTPPPAKDFTERATLEFEGESRFRLATTPGGTHPEIFGENAIVFTKEEVSAAAEHPSIIGTWTAQDPAAKDGPAKVTFVFKADNSVVWITEDPKHLFSLSAKYRIDYSTKPIHLDIFDFNDPRPPKDFTWRAIVEFDGESRFRLDSKGESGERPEEFGKKASVFTKVEFSVPAGHPSIIGTWIAQDPGKDGTKMTLEFKADNTVLWITESPKTNLSSSGKYRIDYSTKPIQLDIFDFDLPPRPGKSLTFFGIVDFEGESRFRFDAQICTGEQSDGRPKVFTKDSAVFTKLQ